MFGLYQSRSLDLRRRPADLLHVDGSRIQGIRLAEALDVVPGAKSRTKLVSHHHVTTLLRERIPVYAPVYAVQGVSR
jgi:hypothetical protein